MLRQPRDFRDVVHAIDDDTKWTTARKSNKVAQHDGFSSRLLDYNEVTKLEVGSSAHGTPKGL